MTREISWVITLRQHSRRKAGLWQKKINTNLQGREFYLSWGYNSYINRQRPARWPLDITPSYLVSVLELITQLDHRHCTCLVLSQYFPQISRYFPFSYEPFMFLSCLDVNLFRFQRIHSLILLFKSMRFIDWLVNLPFALGGKKSNTIRIACI